MASPAKVIAMMVVVVLAAGVAYEITRPKPPAPVRASSSGPPANADYVEDSPLGVLAAGGGAKNPVQAQAAKDELIGKWVPDAGWEGNVESITQERTGPALRLQVLDPKIVGGSYWIIALVGDDHGVKVNETVRVQGKIKEVRSIVGPGPTITNRIVLEEARVVQRPAK